MIVVADTSPLLYLARLGLLDLLPPLYGSVTVPTTVWRELTEYRPDAPGVAELLGATWITVDASADLDARLPALEAEIDPGEAAAITLALLLHAELVLVDDRDGRDVAVAHGLAVRGTLGVLTTARERGLLAALRPVLDDLRAAGFRVHRTLYEAALRRVGEHEG